MKSSNIRALAASALLVVAGSAVSAQTATQSAAAASVTSDPWAKVPVGVYKLDIALPDQVMPATVAVRDSSGAPAATFTPEGQGETMQVKVAIKGAELYVNGDAPKGPFELVLLRQGGAITGRWTYGGDTGKLTGKVQPDISH